MSLNLNNGPVAWKARRQTCATLSSSEAEFVAAAMRDQKVIFLLALLRGLGHVQLKPTPTQVWEDKVSCILMAQNLENRERSQRIDTRIHFIRDLRKLGAVKLSKCAGLDS